MPELTDYSMDDVLKRIRRDGVTVFAINLTPLNRGWALCRVPPFGDPQPHAFEKIVISWGMPSPHESPRLFELAKQHDPNITDETFHVVDYV